MFSHIVIMYFGPLKVQVEGLFYGAPQYDIPALFAFFSLLITTINFVASVEVRFYPKYRNYYGLFNDNGSIRDIQQAEVEMLDRAIDRAIPALLARLHQDRLSQLYRRQSAHLYL